LPKLWVVHRALGLRREHAEWFGAEAPYQPMECSGPEASRVVAYARGENVVTVVPRWMQGGMLPDATVALPGGTWTNVLSNETLQGGSLAMRDLLRTFPVALLVRSAGR
jgi:(1->4)-alpha-D-glucan 1-alpha-D-glucosylmutase